MRVSGSDPTRIFRRIVCSNESCGARNPETYRYCMKCGTSLAAAQPSARAETPDSAAADSSGEKAKPSLPAGFDWSPQ